MYVITALLAYYQSCAVCLNEYWLTTKITICTKSISLQMFNTVLSKGDLELQLLNCNRFFFTFSICVDYLSIIILLATYGL